MELGASLHHLHLTSPDPQRLADFYSRTHGLAPRAEAGRWVCAAPGRMLVLSAGPANRLAYALFGFADAGRWQAFKERVGARATAEVPPLPVPYEDALAARDPDGNLAVFALRPGAPPGPASGNDLPPAHTQHFALRTLDPAPMLAFYEGVLGFTLSDRVQDDEGVLRACFLRTETLHHALALFRAPVNCFDHQSFETASWNDMKTWGDHMATIRETIVWGIGRHGPGDDVFFMVRDPDGNLAEISAEIEVCAPDRPAGVWVHEERTLNLWGKAIMRD
ncbi:VOC family protein [Pigmentiphaga sp. GD03639]|uniref:VOC family protein n=1 Tax=Pigmentiphaga sp. GD03639 TaxID=2975354 RepID=UPI00244C671E|nr:VOC family protein [Pigmentiphaga sp. GD03639]MDH2238539.1 VOC family protein [Pigmentiphaga sp. GD03639]